MGLLKRVKRAVTGPVAVDIAVGDTFRWTDDSLTIAANLTNQTDAPLAVSEVRFALEAPSSGNRNASTWKLKQTLSDPFVLDPGVTVDRTVEFALERNTSRSALENAATAAGLPALVGGAMNAVVGEIPHRPGPHRISVTVKLDGSPRLSSGRASSSAV